MPTNIRSTSYVAYIPASEAAKSARAEDTTVLLLWTATGLALSLGLAAFGMAPDVAQSLLMIG